jgi:histidyl-tRNA synthetase
MGLQDGHPEKEGVLVDLKDLVSEVKRRLQRKATIDAITTQAEGLRVVGGIRGIPGVPVPEEISAALTPGLDSPATLATPPTPES